MIIQDERQTPEWESETGAQSVFSRGEPRGIK